MSFTISEAAALMGVTASTLRYYDKEGLLPNIRRLGGQRVFEEADLRMLSLLMCLKNTGMPLRHIREYVKMTQEGDSTLQARCELIRNQRQFVMDQMEQLQNYLDLLDFKDWYYKKALEAGTEKGIDFADYERETGRPAPEVDTPDGERESGSEA